MNILFLGDTHGDRGFCLSAIRYAAENDIDKIVQVGDFGYWPRTNNGGKFLHDVGKAASKAGIEWYWLAGNHEDHDALDGLCLGYEQGSFVVHGKYPLNHIRNGASWTWDGVRFGCFSGAFSIDRKRRIEGSGSYGWFRQETPDRSVIDGLGAVDVLLTHDAPIVPPVLVGAPIVIDDNCIQSQSAVREALQASGARLLVHGHWHLRQRYGVLGATVEGLDMNEHGLGAAGSVFVPSTMTLYKLNEWSYRECDGTPPTVLEREDHE